MWFGDWIRNWIPINLATDFSSLWKKIITFIVFEKKIKKGITCGRCDVNKKNGIENSGASPLILTLNSLLQIDEPSSLF